MLSARETKLLQDILEIFTRELIMEQFGTYDYEVSELAELECKLLETCGFTIKIK